MSEVSKFINLLIEYGEKIESLIHKKYRPFIRSTLNLQSLARNVHPGANNHVTLTTQIIVFRLGLESKSNKCVEISLQYLHKLFSMNFVDLYAPNYCENYIIEEDGVRQKVVEKYDKEIRHQLVRLLEPLVHFKSNEINQHLLKNFEYLIGEQVLQPIVEICYSFPAQSAYSSLCSYMKYRAYLYEEYCLYTEAELKSANALLIKTDKIEEQLKKARDHDQKFAGLIEKYLQEGISREIIKDGGKHGYCVMCGQPSNHYCKETKASLCGVDCKKLHLEIAQRFYKENIQSRVLQKELIRGLTYLLECLFRKESTLLLNVIVYTLENSSLFLLLKPKFRAIIKKSIPKLLSKLYESKNESTFANIYVLMGNVTKFYSVECFSEVGYFLKTSILKVLQDRKPKYHSLMLTFKTLAKLFQNGKTILQLYVNYDCQLNQENILQKILFELAKIAQDKFSNNSPFNKQQRQGIKNSCITLFTIMVQAMNEYRKTYPFEIKGQADELLALKHRKTCIEKFILKFNEDWSSGLKTLFNMGLVGLDSDEEITDIILSCKGLKKEQIDLMMFSEPGQVYFKVFIKRIQMKFKGIFRQFMEYFRYIPLSIPVFMIEKSSLGQKMFLQRFSHDRSDRNLEKDVVNWIETFRRMNSFEIFKNLLPSIEQLIGIPSIENINHQQEIERLYLLSLEAREDLTLGSHQHFYTHCCSKSYLDVLAPQISLLQIPISYLLETAYDLDRVLSLVAELTQVCNQTNWVSMLIKSSFSGDLKTTQFTADNVKIIKAVLEIAKQFPEFITDWLTVLGFIKNLHHSVVQTGPRRVSGDGQQPLLMEISVISLQKCLLTASESLVKGFSGFMNSMLTIAKQDMKQDRPFMLQKYFQVLENNLHKYLFDFDTIFGQLSKFTVQVPDANSQALIYIADMLKQSLIKLLKKDLNRNIEKTYFTLLGRMLEKDNREVGDFVMNCLSMVVMHHYKFHQESWQLIFEIMTNQAKSYRHQVHLIEQKIVTENLQGCQQFSRNLVKICLALVDPIELRCSIESIHAIKKILTNLLTQLPKNQLKIVFNQTIISMVNFIEFQCHESAIEMIFILMQTRLTFSKNDPETGNSTSIEEDLFTQQDFCSIFERVYSYLDGLPIQLLERGEKIMNQSLYWSVKHKNYSIISNLEKCIVEHYGQFSLTATKCIKTFIQMVNPKEKQEWIPIEATLIRIIRDTKLSKTLPKTDIYGYDNQNDNAFENLNIPQFTKKLIIQKMAVELLPNDAECLEDLQEIYEQAILFNDNIDLRCRLWKSGLGNRGDSAPNILNLQQVISNRILAIFNSTHKINEMYLFGSAIMTRYRESSIKLQDLNSQKAEELSIDYSNVEYQIYQISRKYWQLRRIPLEKILIYLLPKVGKFCLERIQKQMFSQKLIGILPHVEKRDSYLKAIEQLTGIRAH